MTKKLSPSKINLIIFGSFFFVRYFFLIFSNYDNYELQPDSYWYSDQSEEVLRGNFNLLRPLFITSPFFTYYQAIIKFIFGDYWEIILEFSQVSIASISAIYFYKLSLILFKNKKVSILALIVFCFYPFTFWYVGAFTQDIWFQSFLIIFMFYFSMYLKNLNIKNLIFSAVIFSITFLTKSHILIFALFIPLVIFFLNYREFKKKIFHIILFTSICLICTLPYGLYNLKVNGVYVLSSNGFGGLFILGHNEDAYINHIKTPKINSAEAKRLKSVDYKILKTLDDKILNSSPREIQKIYFDEGLKWIKENPSKSKELLIFNFKRFFTPGLHKSWYNYNTWLLSVILSSPIMILGYLGLLMLLFNNFNKYSWILYLFLSLLFFSLIFYYQGRFKVITLEPILILLSAYSFHKIIIKNFLRNVRFK
jgi:hypothetical protein